MTEGIDPIEAALKEVAAETGATVRRAPRAGREVRRVVLRDLRDELGSQSELAVVEDDGTLRVLGHDQGARVSVFFGSGITSYEWTYVVPPEWTYVVPPERVGNLLATMGAGSDDDMLDLLAGHHQRAPGDASATSYGARRWRPSSATGTADPSREGGRPGTCRASDLLRIASSAV